MTTKTTPRNKTAKNRRLTAPKQEPTTLVGHLNEVKVRLFWVGICFLVSAALVYPFFSDVIALLTSPLNGTTLYYFTPAGGLSFIIKICMYIGIIGAMPAFIYHLYRFVQPVMSVKKARILVGYTLSSAALAVLGILFTYNFILPTAIGFLTSFDIANVEDQLSVDSYMSFVIVYIIAGALLFQLPLVMLIINGIRPLSGKTLLSHQRHVFVTAFVVGAVLSPTPDVVNQSLLAMPLIAMYQVGTLLVVVRNRTKLKRAAKGRRAIQKAATAAGYGGSSGPSLEEMLAELPRAGSVPLASRPTNVSALIEVPQIRRAAQAQMTNSVATQTAVTRLSMAPRAVVPVRPQGARRMDVFAQKTQHTGAQGLAPTKETRQPQQAVATQIAPQKPSVIDMQFAKQAPRATPRTARGLTQSTPARPLHSPVRARAIGDVRRVQAIDGFGVYSFDR